MDEATKQEITAADVRARAALVGLTIDEDAVEEIAGALENALAPLRGLDLGAMRLVEPAIAFDATRSE